MTKRNLAILIHEYNLPCKNVVKPGERCELCWRIAGQIMIAQGTELTHAGCEPLNPKVAPPSVEPHRQSRNPRSK